ncbi:hypothetical protein [Phascolarctobacterium succinatutens]|uniref:hypothetical protein n=1 Tax=Phascolarctobacterium succinatutens TaxID=626940 RepID=UPI0023EF7272|nr:hypothetical protein [Phascolarctobacterium succinatutens]
MKVYILKDYIDPEYRKLTPEQLEKDIQDEIEKSKELTEWPCPFECIDYAKPYPLSRTFLREREKQQFLPEPLLLSFY